MSIAGEATVNMVQLMRKIRDEINNEIMDMTFEEERAYLDKLLQANKVNTEEIKKQPIKVS